MKKQQVNIRLPDIITEAIRRQADLTGLSNNDVYTMALFEYLTGKGMLNAERKK